GPEGRTEDKSEDHAKRVLALVAIRRADAEQEAGGEGNGLNAGEDTENLDVQAHVAVDDVAELVGDDALELIAFEAVDCASGYANDGILGVEAGGESVDAALAGQHVNGPGLNSR